MDMGIKQFEIYFVDLDPTMGSEINKMRPCVIVSPNDINRVLNTVIVAPLTSTIRNYPTRINCTVEGKNGQVAIDQLRAIDKYRLKRKLASLDNRTSFEVLDTIQDLFSY